MEKISSKDTDYEAPAKRILVGVVGAPHGIRGLVRVESLSDFPSRFAPGSIMWAMPAAKQLEVESSAPYNAVLLVKFAGIDDRNAAELLRSARLEINQEQVAPLPEGKYYHFQIAGLAVYEGAERLGVVREVLPGGIHDLYIVDTDNGGEIMIPALKKVVKKIDLAGGKMEVELPLGLI